MGLRRKAPLILGALIAVAAVLALVLPLTSRFDYTVTGVLPAGNPNLIEGGKVYVNGFEKGVIDSIEPVDNQAVITLSIDRELAPLHSGARMEVQWKALVGQRVLVLTDGPSSAPTIPSGGRVDGDFPRPTEVSDVLGALDPATRAHLGPLARQLQGTFAGREQDLAETVRTAGPSLQALGSVLRGVGTDGPAIRSLVTDTNALMAKVNSRNADVQGVVNDLSTDVRNRAQQRAQLRQVLQKLPGTLTAAQGALAQVPSTTEATLPLLGDLEEATGKLPSVADNLAPVLTDLRPTIADLRPTLDSASELLQYTPGLLDSAHGAVPGATQAFDQLMPALEFLRPYTPEATAFLTSWGSAGQNFDANGKYMRIHGQAGPTSLNANPGILPPGVTQDGAAAPGDLAKPSNNAPILLPGVATPNASAPQPQGTDASGEGIR